MELYALFRSSKGRWPSSGGRQCGRLFTLQNYTISRRQYPLSMTAGSALRGAICPALHTSRRASKEAQCASLCPIVPHCSPMCQSSVHHCSSVCFNNNMGQFTSVCPPPLQTVPQCTSLCLRVLHRAPSCPITPQSTPGFLRVPQCAPVCIFVVQCIIACRSSPRYAPERPNVYHCAPECPIGSRCDPLYHSALQGGSMFLSIP